MGKALHRNGEKPEICQCCGFEVENEPLKLTCRKGDLAFLGTGIPLYFEFIQACCHMMLGGILFFTIFASIQNYYGDDCLDKKEIAPNECQLSSVTRLSLVNQRYDDKAFQRQAWVTLGVVILFVCLLHLYRKQARDTEQECDRKIVSPSDYTVEIGGLPLVYTENDIREAIAAWWKNVPKSTKEETEGFPIKKINIAYDIGEYYQKTQEKNQCLQNIRKVKYYRLKNKDKYPKGTIAAWAVSWATAPKNPKQASVTPIA